MGSGIKNFSGRGVKDLYAFTEDLRELVTWHEMLLVNENFSAIQLDLKLPRTITRVEFDTLGGLGKGRESNKTSEFLILLNNTLTRASVNLLLLDVTPVSVCLYTLDATTLVGGRLTPATKLLGGVTFVEATLFYRFYCEAYLRCITGGGLLSNHTIDYVKPAIHGVYPLDVALRTLGWGLGLGGDFVDSTGANPFAGLNATTSLTVQHVFGWYECMFINFFWGGYNFLVTGVFEFIKELILPYHASPTTKRIGGAGSRTQLTLIYFLTFHFKKRSLYVGLQETGGDCIFSYTAGMFLPDYRKYWLPKNLQRGRLKYIRGLKPKAKKEYHKKTPIIRWKCKRYTLSTKLYLAKFIHLWLVWARPIKLGIILHGIAHSWPTIIREALGTAEIDGGSLAKKHKYLYLCVYGGFRCVLSQRAIKRRLTKRMWKAQPVTL